jgi:transposase
MAKSFLPYNLNQQFLLPLDMRQWLPEGHLALFISDLVHCLDLSEILSVYREQDSRGRPSYHPTMMICLLLYAYCIGKPSSRKIEKATYEDIAFRVLSGNQHPDHDSIASFRQRHLTALAALFSQVLLLCEKAGLVKLGHIAIDGTKIRANASKHKAMSYERMETKEKELEKEVIRLLTQAQAIDAEEDQIYGKNKMGDELPKELVRREDRLRKIKEAKEALEKEAKEKARIEAEKAQSRTETNTKSDDKNSKNIIEKAACENIKPLPKSQKNFTDPESRIMPDSANKGSFVQAYNCQIAVDGEAQIIVALDVTQQANDKQQLVPMAEKIIENCGRLSETLTADSGYFSEEAIGSPLFKETNLLVPPNKCKREDAVFDNVGDKGSKKPASKSMRAKLSEILNIELYKKRKSIVEPVFGQIKEIRNFRRFLFRGLNAVKEEFTLISLAHNLLKLYRNKFNVCHS